MPYKANWQFPVMGNFLTGEHGKAVAIICDTCLEANKTPDKVIQFDGDNIIYHKVENLQKI